jgi:hypothetical protein
VSLVWKQQAEGHCKDTVRPNASSRLHRLSSMSALCFFFSINCLFVYLYDHVCPSDGSDDLIWFDLDLRTKESPAHKRVLDLSRDMRQKSCKNL